MTSLFVFFGSLSVNVGTNPQKIVEKDPYCSHFVIDKYCNKATFIRCQSYSNYVCVRNWFELTPVEEKN